MSDFIVRPQLSQAERVEAFETGFEQLLEHSRTDIFLYCSILTANWIARERCFTALKKRLIENSTTHIRVLIDERHPDLSELADLLALARRLPSRLTLRCVNDENVHFNQFKMLDRAHYLTAKTDDKEGLPEAVNYNRLHPNKEQTERASFFLIWDHQTWDNPYLREIPL